LKGKKKEGKDRSNTIVYPHPGRIAGNSQSIIGGNTICYTYEGKRGEKRVNF